MSQTTAATTIATRGPKRAPRQPLRVVSARETTGRIWFPLTCLVLLLLGLGSVLALNIAMARDAFTIAGLESRATALANSEESLTAEVETKSAPANLARRASAMGMVPSQDAAFVDLADGTVRGVARPAKKQPAFSVEGAAKTTPDTTPTIVAPRSSTTATKTTDLPAAPPPLVLTDPSAARADGTLPSGLVLTIQRTTR
ncbi:hypothetical protein [Janibacter sp. GXQ6167]|uniref:hypothetical protein n=1 Tax=Janibacter sp. GXQ6167 TaxID=3240791 RepID=UPI003524F88A